MSSVMATFPEWSDDDSGELDDFLSKPWPDETVRTNEDGWPEFQQTNKWKHFSSNQTTKIVSISAVPSNEDDGRDENNYKGNDWNDVRDEDADDESVLTLSSLAGATVELALSAARPATPPKPVQSQRLLRQKLPMLLCKSERLKQPSPGEKSVRFDVDQDNEENIPLDPIIEIGVDFNTEKVKIKRPIVMKPPVICKPPRFQQSRSSSRPAPQKVTTTTPTTTATKDLCFQDSSLEAYSGKCSPSNWIHNANLFEDKTLPSNTLDFFCRDSALAGSVPSVKEVSYSEEDTVTCSSQSTGSGISSLPCGAVDSKLAQVFSLSSINGGMGARDPPAPRISARDPPAARRDPPPRVSVQQDGYGNHEAPTERFEDEYDSTTQDRYGYHKGPSIDTTSPYNNSHALFSHAPPSGSKVADRQKWLNAAFSRDRPNLDGKPGSASVSKAIEQFGGRASRVNAVQQRKEELERKLAEKSKGLPTFKTKWEGRPGSYKKKVVLSSSSYY